MMKIICYVQIGQPELYEDHNRLKNYRTEEKQMLHNHKERQERLNKLIEKNERLHGEVERYNMRQQLLERVEILEKKRAWVVCTMCPYTGECS